MFLVDLWGTGMIIVLTTLCSSATPVLFKRKLCALAFRRDSITVIGPLDFIMSALFWSGVSLGSISISFKLSLA